MYIFNWPQSSSMGVISNIYLFVYLFIAVVRLIGGQNKYEGTVEIYHNGWGTICDDNFGQMEATVICRMLGFLG